MQPSHYKKVTSGATLRGREEILRFFAGLELIDPGWSRSLTGVPTSPSPLMPARYGFSAALAVSPARPRRGACEATHRYAAC